jgi:uncharacterized membrane protein YuzA (DUF378 family)
MKTIKNEKLIKRNSQIGQWTSLGALVILGGGMYISFTRPQFFSYSLIALVLGFMLTQVGMYFGNRFGRSPRPDEKLDAALKGLPGDFTMYHYYTPVSHLLVGLAGIWVIIPIRQRGKISYIKNRWRLSGGGFVQGYMSIFGQEGLGRPDIEVQNETQAAAKYISQKMEGAEVPEVRGILVFTHDEVEIETNDAPMPAVVLKKLKDFMRQKAKEQLLSIDKIKQISELLEK